MNEDKSLIEYRVGKLEEAVTQLVNSLTVLKDIVVRWDNKVGNTDWPGKSAVNDERMTNLVKEIVEIKEEQKVMKTELDGMKSIMWKASGALVVLSIIVQLAGPMMLEKVFGHNNQPRIELIEK